MPAPVYVVVTVFNGGNMCPLFIWGEYRALAGYLMFKDTGTIRAQSDIPNKKTARMIAMAGLRAARLQSGRRFEGDCLEVDRNGLC
jgi:hypothetical protein